jgi:ADP-dependent NAD(P)H-hydrate dehydratase
MSQSPLAEVRAVDARALADLDAPSIPDSGSKHDRGRALIVGGSRETPGAMLLGANAAMRAGAGVVQVATAASAASALSIAVPEARIIPLHEVGVSGAVTDDGNRVAELAGGVNAVIVGPGTLEIAPTRSLLYAAVDGLGAETTLIVDAAALDVLADDPDLLASVAERVVLMPNLNEAARLTGHDRDDVMADPTAVLEELVNRFGMVVAVRGTETWVSGPESATFCNSGGHQLLGVAGSGDVLGGLLLGFAARGFTPLAATVSAVYAHARAGERLAAAGPAVGRFARELLDELPAVVEAMTEETQRAT